MKTIMKKQLSILFSLIALFGGINSLHAQGVAQGTSQYVNQFTGDFNYSVPLITITGPNGESFPLTANYNAGIAVEQEASWIGLGWTLNTGSISRQVKGVPDDWDGKIVYNEKLEQLTSSPATYALVNRPYEYECYGPLHFNQLPQLSSSSMGHGASPGGNVKVMDTYQTSRGVELDRPFQFPDYDSYYLSGPGIGGSIRPQILEFGTLKKFDHDDYTYSSHSNEESPVSYLNEKINFTFVGEPGSQIRAPYYGKDPNGQVGWTTYLDMALTLSSVNASFKTPNDTYNDNEVFTGDVNPALDRQLGGHYVEYWTNDEIDYHFNAGGYNSGTSYEIPGFLNFEIVGSTGNRNNASYDQNGIGAYRVTTPSGMVYHYSLPVYTLDEKVYTFDLNDDYTYAGAWDNLEIGRKADKYATSWLLTAITGPEYLDANENNYVDDGDKGYWIALDYTQWSNDFSWRSPYYGYHSDLQTNRKKQIDLDHGKHKDYETYGEQGNVSMGTKQLWYLDKIRTATQTAFFVKEVRKDAHGFEEDGSTIPQPKLALSKIVLLDNDDLSAFPTTASIANPSGVSFTLPTGPALKTVNNVQYAANKTNIESVSLRTIEFDQDYSLANNSYNNISSNYGTTDQKVTQYNPELLVFRKINSKADMPSSGKLTLNKITAYDFGHDQITPSWDFDYGPSSENPDYDHQQTTYFGYYNSSNSPCTTTSNIVRGGYTTASNKDDADAWSLRKVLTPLGGEMAIFYESDEYEKVGYSRTVSVPSPPERIFRIKTMDFSTGTHKPKFTVYEPGDVAGLLPDKIKADAYYHYNCLTPCNSDEKNEANVSIVNLGGTNSFQITGGVAGTNCTSTNCTSAMYNYNSTDGYAFIKLYMDKVYGGGIRVRSLDIKENANSNALYTNLFTYEGGIASNEPDRFAHDKISNELRRASLAGDRHAMGPNVGYASVTEQQKRWTLNGNGTSSGKTVHNFNNYSEPYSAFLKSSPIITGTGGNQRTRLFEVISMTKTSFYGLPKSILVYDKEDKLMASTLYEYESRRENMGKKQEVFYRGMDISNVNIQGGIIEVQSVYLKTELTSQLRKTTSFIDGITTVTEHESWDKYTGIPTLTRIESPTTGITYREKKLAYETYSNMGPKTENNSKENRLTYVRQELIKYLDSDDEDTKGGGKQQFQEAFYKRKFNNGKFETISTSGNYHPKESYAFKDFTGGSLTWKYTGETTLFDEQNRVLEQKGIDNTFTAMRYGYDNRYVVAQAANANYASFTHCGFETNTDIDQTTAQDYYFEGEVKNSTNLSTLNFQVAGTVQKPAHTGDYMAELPYGQTGPTFTTKEENEVVGTETIHRGLQPGRTYRASVWVHSDSPDNDSWLVMHLIGTHGTGGSAINDLQAVEKANAVYTAGDWKLMQLNITVPDDYVSGTTGKLMVYVENTSSSSKAWFDDLRFQPIDAQVTALIYDKKRGLVTHALDNENFFSRNVYDSGGRVIETWIEQENGQKKASSNSYHFARD